MKSPFQYLVQYLFFFITVVPYNPYTNITTIHFSTQKPMSITTSLPVPKSGFVIHIISSPVAPYSASNSGFPLFFGRSFTSTSLTKIPTLTWNSIWCVTCYQMDGYSWVEPPILDQTYLSVSSFIHIIRRSNLG